MAAALAVFGLGAAGCVAVPRGADEGPEPAPPRTVSVAEVCGGTLLSADAGKALERVLGSTEFRVSKPEDDRSAADLAEVMERAYRSGAEVRNMPSGVCLIKGKHEGNPKATMRFTAGRGHAPLPDDAPGANRTGVTVHRGVTDHTIGFDCVSVRVGSTAKVPLRVTAEFDARGAHDARDGATRAADQLALVHSGARSVAAELACESGGGLPDRYADLERFAAESKASATPAPPQ
ncbi:hypothetical protein ACFWSF_20835 [Streptomyces sp. NPDC058611]|uniref:hypothetical protein n=1 Tax=unclassified Streptomyces TaxID=2593676 RepID=UPI003669D699